jgi:hypothetical protein
MYNRNKSSAPRLVALVPHLEDGEWAGGMDVVTLPYANEVRAAPIDSTSMPVLSNELIDVTEKFVDAFQLDEDFRYVDLENPSIQHVYSVLQAFALNEVLC